MRKSISFAAIVFCLTFAAYWPAMRGGLVWDDDAHVTKPELRSLHGLRQIWLEVGATQQYYPVVHTAFWLEHRLWRDAPLGYHLVNVFLHALSACLVAAIFSRLSIPGGWIAAFVFALHPVCVESVAWISEQKNTLSGVFYLSAMVSFLHFSLQGESGSRKRGRYALASVLFVLAVMAKSVTATLPAALLIILWWRNGRLSLKRDIVPLLPWFAFGLGFVCVTAWVEHRMLEVSGVAIALTWTQKTLLAGRAIGFYLRTWFWPANLIFIYPAWVIDPSDWRQYLAPLGVAVLAIALWRRPFGLGRGPFAGFLFFVGTLVPALGFSSAFPFRYSFVADHFQYLASLGILAPLAAGAGARLRGGAKDPILCLIFAIVAALGVLTWRQCRMYRDAETLYRVTIEREPACWMARTNLGVILMESGRTAEAASQFALAVREKPDLAEAHCDLGNALQALGRYNEAVSEYERALQIDRRFPEVYQGLGDALFRAGRAPQAVGYYIRAIELRPDDPLIHCDLAAALATEGNLRDASAQYRLALGLSPDLAEAHEALGLVLAGSGNPREAVVELAEAVRLRPDNARFHYDLSVALRNEGRIPESMQELTRALQIDPNLIR